MFFRNAVAVMLLLATAPSMANLYRVTYNALVVGNARYPNMEIRNGVNDAKLIAQGFKQNGFEVVTVYEADRVALLESLSQFVAEPKDGSSRELTVVYLSGAGFHCNGEDFFIPHMSIQKNMRKKISLHRQMMERAVPLRQIRERLDGLGGQLILIFDAGRLVPDAKCSQPSARTQLKSHWLNVYSSAPGEVALDGDVNSPFAAALAKWLKRTDLTALDVFQTVANDVWQNTNTKQRVHIDSLMPYHIRLCQPGSCLPAPAQQEMPAANNKVQPAVEFKER